MPGFYVAYCCAVVDTSSFSVESEVIIVNKKDKLLSIAEKFGSDYRATLKDYEPKIGEANFNALHDLGGDIKHALEAIANELSE